MSKLLTKLAQSRKAIAGAVGGLAQLVAAGVLHGNALLVASGVIAIATGLGIYHVPNA